jgi:hypothetical protein
MAGCCECGDEPSGSGATELVSYEETTMEIVFLSSRLLRYITVGGVLQTGTVLRTAPL